MAAPSAVAEDPWAFVVVRDRGMLSRIAAGLPNGTMLRDAAWASSSAATSRAHDRQLSYLLQDCSAAIENLLVAASALGLGACWLGVHPREDRVKHIRRCCTSPTGAARRRDRPRLARRVAAAAHPLPRGRGPSRPAGDRFQTIGQAVSAYCTAGCGSPSAVPPCGSQLILKGNAMTRTARTPRPSRPAGSPPVPGRRGSSHADHRAAACAGWSGAHAAQRQAEHRRHRRGRPGRLGSGAGQQRKHRGPLRRRLGLRRPHVRQVPAGEEVQGLPRDARQGEEHRRRRRRHARPRPRRGLDGGHQAGQARLLRKAADADGPRSAGVGQSRTASTKSPRRWATRAWPSKATG